MEAAFAGNNLCANLWCKCYLTLKDKSQASHQAHRHAEKQSILIPTPLLNAREFLLGENNTDNSTLGRHVRSSL